MEDVFADQMPTGLISSTYRKENGETCVYARTECDRHTITCAVRLDNRRIIDETYGIRLMGGIFAVFMISLVAIVFLFFHKKVTMPMADLVEAYGRIEREEYGYHFRTVYFFPIVISATALPLLHNVICTCVVLGIVMSKAVNAIFQEKDY